ncbi:MAG: protein kinase [Deltaproteobacteria bacterium]|nr:protein kinase [Deltaproteobacteria bacterium]
MTDERAGEVLVNKYRLNRCLGVGGMGEVYLAENLVLGGQVAIKLLRADAANNPQVIARFLREGKAANKVRHPNVVMVFDVGEDSKGCPFIVQEYLQGQDLASHFGDLGGRIASQSALALMLPVIDAVGAAHRAGVLHRDIKPENVFLARVDQMIVPKVLDFGISRMVDDTSEQRLTATHVAIGTPLYMAPESIRGLRHTVAASDVWSLGVMLYEMLAGAPPFQGESTGDLFLSISSDPLPPLDPSTVPAALRAIIEKSLQKNAQNRYADAGEMAADLRLYLRGEPIVQPQDRAPQAPVTTATGTSSSGLIARPLLPPTPTPSDPIMAAVSPSTSSRRGPPRDLDPELFQSASMSHAVVPSSDPVAHTGARESAPSVASRAPSNPNLPAKRQPTGGSHPVIRPGEPVLRPSNPLVFRAPGSAPVEASAPKAANGREANASQLPWIIAGSLAVLGVGAVFVFPALPSVRAFLIGSGSVLPNILGVILLVLSLIAARSGGGGAGARRVTHWDLLAASIATLLTAFAMFCLAQPGIAAAMGEAAVPFVRNRMLPWSMVVALLFAGIYAVRSASRNLGSIHASMPDAMRFAAGVFALALCVRWGMTVGVAPPVVPVEDAVNEVGPTHSIVRPRRTGRSGANTVE